MNQTICMKNLRKETAIWILRIYSVSRVQLRREISDVFFLRSVYSLTYNYLINTLKFILCYNVRMLHIFIIVIAVMTPKCFHWEPCCGETRSCQNDRNPLMC